MSELSDVLFILSKESQDISKHQKEPKYNKNEIIFGIISLSFEWKALPYLTQCIPLFFKYISKESNYKLTTIFVFYFFNSLFEFFFKIFES